MKAYSATNNSGYGFIVYAESCNKAKSYLFQNNDFNEYTEIRVYREPKMDKYYRGESELDWDNLQDRIAVVKELHWHCVGDSFSYLGCETCSAKEFCDKYNDWLNSEVSE